MGIYVVMEDGSSHAMCHRMTGCMQFDHRFFAGCHLSRVHLPHSHVVMLWKTLVQVPLHRSYMCKFFWNTTITLPTITHIFQKIFKNKRVSNNIIRLARFVWSECTRSGIPISNHILTLIIMLFNTVLRK